MLATKEKFNTLLLIYSLGNSRASLRGKKIDVLMFCNVPNKILRRNNRWKMQSHKFILEIKGIILI